jgi:hypothetical protein
VLILSTRRDGPSTYVASSLKAWKSLPTDTYSLKVSLDITDEAVGEVQRTPSGTTEETACRALRKWPSLMLKEVGKMTIRDLNRPWVDVDGKTLG